MYNICQDFIEQHIYHSFFLLLYHKDYAIVYENHVFSKFINVISILYYNFIKFIILLLSFLVISFTQYKKNTYNLADFIWEVF